ncbi:PREDICTED: uncharacterized protein LOC108615837 [Drosophila arizonae]|uniref:Uncharacterized protein LOC108615837 n=1 Tax=Drosophila arizonae TaxID=7263 RepID=A0ABM1PG00_DROAR|nr:PREDICTED: uncharacterized protein LOC108615837 [Drosophila arizonae]
MRHLLQVIHWLLLLLALVSPNNVIKCYHPYYRNTATNKCEKFKAIASKLGDLQPTILVKAQCADGFVWQKAVMSCVLPCSKKGCNHRVLDTLPKPEKQCPIMHYLDLLTKKCIKIVPPPTIIRKKFI